MRFLFKISMPVEAGNAAAKAGFSAIRSILAHQKPEPSISRRRGANEPHFSSSTWTMSRNYQPLRSLGLSH